MKIKLRDMTFEQYKKWHNDCTKTVNCINCPFTKINCRIGEFDCWANNKELYSDKFLNQEIEIENEPILTDEEREYLSAVIKPFRDNVETIEKIGSEYFDSDIDFVVIHLEEGCISIPIIDDLNFKGMEFEFSYTLEELGL